ncbi:hypothetical protein [Saccharothrix sp. NRRL B-16314]|uniref:hypothetical protein n=1 Tax=Saccharothrix sp. NRRL B-16314 TaxID=1463825 RepID=UPI000526AB0E|nr:hypothetical protein [Saccharothrix sp. NRRL B-16314]
MSNTIAPISKVAVLAAALYAALVLAVAGTSDEDAHWGAPAVGVSDAHWGATPADAHWGATPADAHWG